MWNFAALDRSPTINRQSYFQTGVTPKASSNSRKTLCPVTHFHPNFFPPANTWDFRPTRTHSACYRTYTPPPPQTPRYAPPSPKSHVIPPGPHSSAAQKPRNINDLISNPETSSRELRAKLLSCTRFLGRPARRPPRGLRGLAGLRDDAPGHTPAARRRQCGGRRRDRRARAGFEARRRTK